MYSTGLGSFVSAPMMYALWSANVEWMSIGKRFAPYLGGKKKHSSMSSLGVAFGGNAIPDCENEARKIRYRQLERSGQRNMLRNCVQKK